jgi:hypothetical protein
MTMRLPSGDIVNYEIEVAGVSDEFLPIDPQRSWHARDTSA